MAASIRNHMTQTPASDGASSEAQPKRVGEAKVTSSYLRGRLPRTYAWVRTADGRAQRVTILFDSGASHCFMSPRICQALELIPDRSTGPASLLTSNEQEVACEGEVSNVQVLMGQYRQRMPMVIADIGRDDIILGGEVLEMQEGGFGPAGSGMYKLVVSGVEYLIPLIGEHTASKQGVTKRITGTKKILKLFRNYSNHIFTGEVRRATGASHQSTQVGDGMSEQERDAQGYKEGETVTSKASVSESRGGRSVQLKKYLRQKWKTQTTVQRMKDAQTALQEKSDQVKAELIAEFPDVFCKPTSLPPLRWENHRMEVLPGSKMPMARGLPRMSAAELEATNSWLKEMLSKGWIRPSLAPYASRFFFVPKPNGKGLRGVCDFRAINAITKKVLPSLPLFENVVTQLDGAQYFSALDLTEMFYQIRVEPSDVENTAFRTAVGCYEYLVTPMGTTPSVGTAMNTMQQALQHCVSLPGEQAPPNPRFKPPIPPQEGFPDDDSWRKLEYHSALGSYCVVFVDDILIYSKTFEDHVRQLRQLCLTLRQHRMYLNPDKCNLCQVEVEYLGNMIGREGIRPTTEKTETLETWPSPQNVTELKSFLGLLGFCRRYIADLAQISAPLNVLLKKGAPWQWGADQQKAFDKLKRRISSTPVLAIPSGSAELVLRCDASREAMGVALYQRDSQGYLQPVEFKSKGFAEAQKRLAAHDREGLALLFALKSFRHFLLGREFQVQTDNAALSQILTSRDMSDLYSRWYWKIAEFPGMKLSHRAGRKLYCADALSRRKESADEAGDPFFLEPGELFRLIDKTDINEADKSVTEVPKVKVPARCINDRTGQVHVQLVRDASRHYTLKVTNATDCSQASTVVDVDRVCAKSGAFQRFELASEFLTTAQEQWPSLYEADAEFRDIWAAGGDVQWGYFTHNKLLYKEGAAGPRLCIPLGADKVPLLEQVHDSRMAAHCGRHRTLARATTGYYWPGMYGDVVRYVESCHRCQIAKGERRAEMGNPRALSVPQEPWQVIHMDWISGFEPSPEGYDAILVFVDALTSMVHLQPCKKTDTARDTAQHFIHNVVRLHGMPASVVSDRDVRLRAHFWRALQERLGTELRFTTAHAPNSNGKVERVNAVLGDLLRTLCAHSGKDWAQHLDLAEFAINGSTTSATGLTPFFANYARELRTPADLGRPRFDVPAADEFADAMFATIAHTRDTLERAKRKYNTQLAKRRRKSEIFHAGDRVLLSTKNLNLKHAKRKLTSKFVGPFNVLNAPSKATNPNVVWLQTPRALKIHMPINVKNIRRYKDRPPELGGPANLVPEPLIVDGHEAYEVEEILAERTGRAKKPQVLVKWVGFDVIDATWEPLANMPLLVVKEWRSLQQRWSAQGHASDEDDSDDSD